LHFKLLGLERIGIAGSRGISDASGVNSDNGAHEPKSVGNCTKGAAALAGNLGDGKALGTIEAKDGEKAGRVWNAGGIEAVKDLKRDEAGWEEIVES
jgi:hypothetical protein